MGRHRRTAAQLGCRRQCGPAATGRPTPVTASTAACSSKPATWTANGVGSPHRLACGADPGGGERRGQAGGLGAWPTCGETGPAPPPFPGLTPTSSTTISGLVHHHRAAPVQSVCGNFGRGPLGLVDFGRSARTSPAPSAAADTSANDARTAQAGRASSRAGVGRPCPRRLWPGAGSPVPPASARSPDLPPR